MKGWGAYEQRRDLVQNVDHFARGALLVCDCGRRRWGRHIELVVVSL